MNNTITLQNRIWLPLAAAGTALALAVGLLIFVLLQQQTETRQATRAAPTIDAPTTIPQAEWRVQVTPAGAKRISKAERARVDKRAGNVTATVQTIFDTLFLDPANASKMIDANFSRGAAQALGRPGVGLPEGAEEVQTTVRRAKITMYAETAAQATARVHIRLKGVTADRPFVLSHAATLWMQRGDNGWKVVAYEINQKP